MDARPISPTRTPCHRARGRACARLAAGFAGLARIGHIGAVRCHRGRLGAALLARPVRCPAATAARGAGPPRASASAGPHLHGLCASQRLAACAPARNRPSAPLAGRQWRLPAATRAASRRPRLLRRRSRPACRRCRICRARRHSARAGNIRRAALRPPERAALAAPPLSPAGRAARASLCPHARGHAASRPCARAVCRHGRCRLDHPLHGTGRAAGATAHQTRHARSH